MKAKIIVAIFLIFLGIYSIFFMLFMEGIIPGSWWLALILSFFGGFFALGFIVLSVCILNKFS